MEEYKSNEPVTFVDVRIMKPLLGVKVFEKRQDSLEWLFQILSTKFGGSQIRIDSPPSFVALVRDELQLGVFVFKVF